MFVELVSKHFTARSTTTTSTTAIHAGLSVRPPYVQEGLTSVGLKYVEALGRIIIGVPTNPQML